MSLVDDAPHPTDIALQELGERPAASPAEDHNESPVTPTAPEPDRTSEDHDTTDAADGDIEMTTSTDNADTPAEDTAATDSGKENVKEERENGHSAKDAGGVKKILKSGVFGGQCAEQNAM